MAARGLWIRVPAPKDLQPPPGPDGDDQDYYYWCPETQETLWELPEGVECVWASTTEPASGKPYYWRLDDRRTSWDVPTLASEAQFAELGLGAGPGQPGRDIPVSTQDGWPFYLYLPPEERPAPQGVQAQNSAASRSTARSVGQEWVEVSQGDRSAHYWDFRQGLSVRSLPQGARARWRAIDTVVGDVERFYFVSVETGETVWKIQGQPLDDRQEGEDVSHPMWHWLALGAAVLVQGLRGDERYNGQTGRVEGFQEGRVVVKLPDCLAAPRLAVRPENLEPLRPGTMVQVAGLRTRPEFNNQMGWVLEIDLEARRYIVELSPGENAPPAGTHLKMRGENVIPRGGVWNDKLSLGSNFGYLQWRSEQTCLFIDSTRQWNYFSLSFPLSFASYQQVATCDSKVSAWPMLVYMHGAGGTGFFGHAKKSLKSDGLQYAASMFVVVSPHCNWKWTETPKPWVTEMVRELRAADWCDHSRIYLTGCSMGGMSTWELAAASPGLYAAIAPVAGHHAEARRTHIARNLGRTPVCIVHSSADGTCRLSSEQPLWRMVKANDHRQMEIHMSDSLDHCSMYEKAYCDTKTIYDWFLKFRRPE